MIQQEMLTNSDQAIRLRRTIKPERFTGRHIPDEQIEMLLQLADCAPTHARTEPWRFIVFGPEMTKSFATRHADLYRNNADPASFAQQKYDNLARQGDKTSHIILVWMKRVPTHKIPEMEEVAAVSAAIQNILLGATSRGIASFWSTGGMALHPALHAEFKLGEEDKILGILYLGYSEDPFKEPMRLIPLSEKIQWEK